MPLDDADKKAIADLIKTATAALGDDLGKKFVTGDAAQKMVAQGLTKGLTDAGLDKVADTLTGITATLAKLGKPGKDDKDDKPSPELARIKEQMALLETKNREAETARAAAEQRSRNGTLDTKVRAGLTAIGIPADRQDQAIAYIRTLTAEDGKPILRFKDDGTPVYVAQRKGFVDELDVSKGLAEWGTTDAAKVYLPPAGQGGTGAGAGGPGHQRSNSAPRDDKGGLDWGAIGQKMASGALQNVVDE